MAKNKLTRCPFCGGELKSDLLDPVDAFDNSRIDIALYLRITCLNPECGAVTLRRINNRSKKKGGHNPCLYQVFQNTR